MARSLDPFGGKILPGEKSLLERVQRRPFKLLCKMKNEYSTRHECICVCVCVCVYACYAFLCVSGASFLSFFFLAIIINFFFFFTIFASFFFLNCFGGEVGYSVHATR